MSDSFQRPVDYLRISVTDRCNMRCVYCMPPEGVPILPRIDILTYEEIRDVVEAAAELGISKVRLSGGEPLLRSGIVDLVRSLAAIRGIDDLSSTTNGMLLYDLAADLKSAGLKRVNVSLDSLREDRFRSITRCGDLNLVLRGIEVAKTVGLTPVKINVVAMRGVNDDEIEDFALKTVRDGWHVRFIELMPFAIGHTKADEFIGVPEIRKRIEVLGPLEPAKIIKGNGPAKYFRLPGASGTVGFISPVTEHFCFGCNRLRLTADGKLRPCLLSDSEIDLRPALRSGDRAQVRRVIREAVACKPRQHELVKGRIPRRAMRQIGG
ncbi:MAG: GTP 3',8-cyclase MoaA [Chloroflexi bacterium]|nr:GTP 3',8-cyclase MoaA [Chloroflexota bacterium]